MTPDRDKYIVGYSITRCMNQAPPLTPPSQVSILKIILKLEGRVGVSPCRNLKVRGHITSPPPPPRIILYRINIRSLGCGYFTFSHPLTASMEEREGAYGVGAVFRPRQVHTYGRSVSGVGVGGKNGV